MSGLQRIGRVIILHNPFFSRAAASERSMVVSTVRMRGVVLRFSAYADEDIGAPAALSKMGLYFVSFRTGAAVLKMTRVIRSMTADPSSVTHVLDLITVVPWPMGLIF
jgi:hypothetical protein